MLSRLGNVIYWFCLLLLAGGVLVFIYSFFFHSFTQEDYNYYVSWSHSPNMWEEYKKNTISSNHETGLWCLGGGIAMALIGKSLQYVLGGKWRLLEFIKKPN